MTESDDLLIIKFSGENISTIKRFPNSKSDRVYLKDRSYIHRLALRRQHSPQIIVWVTAEGPVTAEGRSSTVFIDPGVKINEQHYREVFYSGGCFEAVGRNDGSFNRIQNQITLGQLAIGFWLA